MADESLDNTGAGGEWISDKTPQGETFRRKRSIDSMTGALITCEEYPARGLSIQTDQLAGKIRRCTKSGMGNYYEMLDFINGYQREVYVQDETLGVAILHLTDQLPRISINYNDTGSGVFGSRLNLIKVLV